MKAKKIIAGIAAMTLMMGTLAGCSIGKQAKSDLSEINVTYVKAPLNVPSIIQKQDDLFGKEFSKDNMDDNHLPDGAGRFLHMDPVPQAVRIC